MNSFVNNQKRDIELPDGCIDLAEVLGTARLALDSVSKWRLVPDVGEAERFLLTLLLAPSRLRSLFIAIPKQKHRVELMRATDGLRLVVSVDCGEPGRLEAVRAVVRDIGISPIARRTLPYGATTWKLIVCPCPAVAPDAAELICQFLRSGFALPEDTQLKIAYRESETA